MTALSADTPRVMEGTSHLALQKYPLKASTTVYSGSAICAEAADGLARPVAASLTSPEFYGFAVESAATTAGDTHVTVMTRGVIILGAITGCDGPNDIGTTIYMSDDGTGFTTTSTNNVAIGKLQNYVGGEYRVAFEADAHRSI